MIFKSYLKIVK